MNRILNHSVTANQLLIDSTATGLNVSAKSKQNTNFLFKFQIYFYSFLTQLDQNSPASLVRTILGLIDPNPESLVCVQTQLKALKFRVTQLLTLPYNLALNKSNTRVEPVPTETTIYSIDNSVHEFIRLLSSKYNMLYDLESYLLLVNDQPFDYKQLLIKQCSVNLKMFVTKFKEHLDDVNLCEMVSWDRFVYIMRHPDVDLATKNLILNTFSDYFEWKRDRLTDWDKEYLVQVIGKHF